MDLPLVSDCLSVDLSGKTAVKSHFSGKTFATIKMTASVSLCTIRPNAVEAEEAPMDATVETYSAQVQDPGLLKALEVQKGFSDKIDLTEIKLG